MSTSCYKHSIGLREGKERGNNTTNPEFVVKKHCLIKGFQVSALSATDAICMVQKNFIASISPSPSRKNFLPCTAIEKRELPNFPINTQVAKQISEKGEKSRTYLFVHQQVISLKR
jgi:hypothetical protein